MQHSSIARGVLVKKSGEVSQTLFRALDGKFIKSVEPFWHSRAAGLWSTLKSTYLLVLSFVSCISLKETNL